MPERSTIEQQPSSRLKKCRRAQASNAVTRGQSDPYAQTIQKAAFALGDGTTAAGKQVDDNLD